MSDKLFETYYREIFSDLSVSPEESDEIKEKLVEFNPPPDKLVWLRACAFRIGSEFLTDDKSSNVSLLRCINGIVHAVETTCMTPKGEEDDDNDDFDEEQVEQIYREVFEDLSLDGEENQDLVKFFKETNCPPKSKLIWTRAAAFRIGVEFISDDGDRDNNVALLKCINGIVHALEMSCMQ